MKEQPKPEDVLFKCFIPELDKEVDMASDLVKAMFGGKEPLTPQVPPKCPPKPRFR